MLSFVACCLGIQSSSVSQLLNMFNPYIADQFTEGGGNKKIGERKGKICLKCVNSEAQFLLKVIPWITFSFIVFSFRWNE